MTYHKALRLRRQVFLSPAFVGLNTTCTGIILDKIAQGGCWKVLATDWEVLAVAAGKRKSEALAFLTQAEQTSPYWVNVKAKLRLRDIPIYFGDAILEQTLATG